MKGAGLMLRVRFFFPLLLGLAALAAACGGGGSSPVPAAPTPTPHAGPTSVPIGPTPQAINISGDGYTLSFTLPPIVTGNTSTMSAVLQTALPAGTTAPQARRHGYTAPRPLAQTYTGLVYLVVSTTDSVGFSYAPSFQFTVPSSVSIPSTSNAYVLYWDPYSPAQAWQPIEKGSVSGQIVSFLSIPTGVQFNAGSNYVFALAETTQVVPTATPAPMPTPAPPATPTPTPAPSISPGVVPAYCKTEGVSQLSGLTLNVTDSSGLNSALVIYVQQQAAVGSTAISWMDTSGNFGPLPVPLPAACYSSTLGSGAPNNPLVIPTDHAGRIYLVYASPVPASSTSAPNPFSGFKTGMQPSNNVAQAPYPYDKIEYNSKSGVIDTTQVDFLGLPMEMQAVPRTNATPLPQAAASACPSPMPTASPYLGNALPGPGTIVGVGQCGYAAIYSALYNAPDSNYRNLVSMLPWGSPTVDFRAVSPGGSYGNNDFNYNDLGDPNVAIPPACSSIVPASPSPAPDGYLSCVLAQYQQHPQVFQASSALGGFGDNDYFCISADAANFIATDVGQNTTCGSPSKATSASLPANPFDIPIALFTNAYQNGSSGACFAGELFSGPWGNANVGSGNAFATADAFTLWKALTLEISYGTMFEAGPHPIETTPPSLQSAGMFGDPASNFYAKILHEYFDGNFAYAISYDDGFKWESGYTLTAPGAINVRVNPVPAGFATTSSNPPIFNTTPTCATFQLGVGSYKN